MVNNRVTCALDPLGLLVTISQRDVWGFGNHTWINLIPDNPSDFKDNPLFGTGRSTVSGFPVNDYLNSVPNRDLNETPTDTVTITAPAGMTDTQFIQAILNAQAKFPNNTLNYDAVFGDGYNCNSFTAGLLNSLGLKGNKIVSDLPGWQPKSDYPVPNIHYE